MRDKVKKNFTSETPLGRCILTTLTKCRFLRRCALKNARRPQEDLPLYISNNFPIWITILSRQVARENRKLRQDLSALEDEGFWQEITVTVIAQNGVSECFWPIKHEFTIKEKGGRAMARRSMFCSVWWFDVIIMYIGCIDVYGWIE